MALIPRSMYFRILCLAEKISYPVMSVQSAKLTRISILRNNKKIFHSAQLLTELYHRMDEARGTDGKDRTGVGGE